MARLYEDRISFIGVGGFDSVDRLQRFVDEHDLHHFPHVATEDGDLYVRFEVSYHPAWILLDPDGEVVMRSVRPSQDEVEAALEAMADG